MPVTSAQCFNGTEKILILAFLNYKYDDYSQGYAQIKGAFVAPTKDDIFQPYISKHVLDLQMSGLLKLDIHFRYTISRKVHSVPTK